MPNAQSPSSTGEAGGLSIWVALPTVELGAGQLQQLVPIRDTGGRGLDVLQAVEGWEREE